MVHRPTARALAAVASSAALLASVTTEAHAEGARAHPLTIDSLESGFGIRARLEGHYRIEDGAVRVENQIRMLDRAWVGDPRESMLELIALASPAHR